MKILVTGTAGFIGFHLVNKLLKRGDEVIGIDNINDYYDVNLKYNRLRETGIEQAKIKYNEPVQSQKYEKYTFIQLDISDREKIEKLFINYSFDIVCNLAAQAGVRYSIENPHSYIDSNIVGFANILEGCRHSKVKHLIYASSSSVYGLNEKMPLSTSDEVNHPVSLYAASKKSNELMAHTYSHLFNLRTTGLRFFTVYGPWGRPDMAYFLFTDAILKRHPIKIFNHGKMERDFTYVSDIIDGIEKVIDNPAQGNENWDALYPNPSSSKAPYKVFNIGNNEPVKLLDFVKAIEEALGKKAEKIMMEIQPGDVEKTYADVSPLMKYFNYKPSTPIRKGIQEFIDWYKNFYNI
jgi:UDP-glucuronate 4-epimerase